MATIAGAGYGAGLHPELVERYRAAGLLPGAAPELVRKAMPVPTREAWRCMGHGVLSGDRCPTGCSRRFLERVEVPFTVEEIEAARRAVRPPVLRAADGTVIAPGAWERDSRGRFLPKPPRQGAPEAVHADERMTPSQVRAELRKLLSHCVAGSKGPLARLCGYTGEWALNSLRGVAQGRAKLPDRCRRRISAVITRIKRGELVLVALPGVRGKGVASHEWRVRSPVTERDAIKLQL